MQHENSRLLGRYFQLEKFDLSAYHKPDNEIPYMHQIIHPASLGKSPHLLKNKFQSYRPTKPYLMNQKKYMKKLQKISAIL